MTPRTAQKTKWSLCSIITDFMVDFTSAPTEVCGSVFYHLRRCADPCGQRDECYKSFDDYALVWKLKDGTCRGEGGSVTSGSKTSSQTRTTRGAQSAAQLNSFCLFVFRSNQIRIGLR
jgi:hypothetical protein